jgi:uncharacterized protein (DUF2267 family)
MDEIMEVIGPDKQVAWHTLGAVLRTLRDRLPLGLAAHLGSQLPLIVRGLYYDQWEPEKKPDKTRSVDEFLGKIGEKLENIRPVNAQDASRECSTAYRANSTAVRAKKCVMRCPRRLG